MRRAAARGQPAAARPTAARAAAGAARAAAVTGGRSRLKTKARRRRAAVRESRDGARARAGAGAGARCCALPRRYARASRHRAARPRPRRPPPRPSGPPLFQTFQTRAPRSAASGRRRGAPWRAAQPRPDRGGASSWPGAVRVSMHACVCVPACLRARARARAFVPEGVRACGARSGVAPPCAAAARLTSSRELPVGVAASSGAGRLRRRQLAAGASGAARAGSRDGARGDSRGAARPQAPSPPPSPPLALGASGGVA